MHGIAENKHQTLRFQTQTVFCSPTRALYWAEAINMANYVLSRLPSLAISDQVPFTLWTCKLPTWKHLRIFEARAYAYIPDQNLRKFDPRVEKLLQVGYMDKMTGYRLILPATHATKYAKSVLVVESVSFKNQKLVAPNTTAWLDPATFGKSLEQGEDIDHDTDNQLNNQVAEQQQQQTSPHQQSSQQ